MYFVAISIHLKLLIILFYLKFYIAYIVAISLSDFMFSNSFLLVIINGLVWVPQIIENVQNKSRNVPTAFIFWFVLSFSQGFMPVYFLLFDSNIFEIKSSSFWGLSLLFMHCASLLILQCQRWFGARFFIPKYLRSRSSYQYHDLFEDPEGDTDKDWAIWLNNLSDDHGLNQNHRDQYSNQYMRTPCGHNFHPSWLKTWVSNQIFYFKIAIILNCDYISYWLHKDEIMTFEELFLNDFMKNSIISNYLN